ncbi:hypothetical protein AB1Y20_021776 [Prymnesium parvum]|uniref:NADP-dependent oxidoreductase domain-containing protein n=1 Tax=Prymnesium parvum TaxID=97485 RepID=A0AB34JJ91_PRYPA
MRRNDTVIGLVQRHSSGLPPADRPVMKGRTLAVACVIVSAAAGVALLRRWYRRSIYALPRRRLGKTGLSVTVVSLGGVGLGGTEPDELYGGVSDEVAIATVHRAIARGINYIDTSPLYRESERRIGLALEALSEAERARVHIGTKVGDNCPPYSDNGGFSPFSYNGVMCSIRHSLRQLRVVKRLETVLLHDPTLAELEEFASPGGGLEALVELQQQGVVGHIGIGCVEHEVHAAFMRNVSSAAVLLSVNDYNLLRRYGSSASWAEAAALGIGVLNAGVFYMGLLADPRNSWNVGFKAGLEHPELRTLAKEMGEWAEARGVHLRTLAIQFGASHPCVASCPVGCRTPEEVDEVVDSMLERIPARIWRDFYNTFESRVVALGREAHWYYNKASSQI